MNIVLITGKRSMRNLDTVLKKSEQAVTVGNKRTRIINGFTSKAGKAFSAALIVKDGKIDFDFPAQSQKRSK